MNKLSKRMKILIGAGAGIVVILAVALVLGFTGVFDEPLQGATSPHLFPDSGGVACILPGGTVYVDMMSYYGLMEPKWSIADGTIAKVTSGSKSGATIQGLKVGETTVKATGSFGRSLGSTNVWVRQTCPSEVHLFVNTSVQLKTTLTGGQWISLNPEWATVSASGWLTGKASSGLKRAYVVYRVPGTAGDVPVNVMVCDRNTSCPSEFVW